MRLTEAQRTTLAVCIQVGGLFRPRGAHYWCRKHPGGYVSRIAMAKTVERLMDYGLLAEAGHDVVAPTPAGRAALSANQDREG